MEYIKQNSSLKAKEGANLLEKLFNLLLDDDNTDEQLQALAGVNFLYKPDLRIPLILSCSYYFSTSYEAWKKSQENQDRFLRGYKMIIKGRSKISESKQIKWEKSTDPSELQKREPSEHKSFLGILENRAMECLNSRIGRWPELSSAERAQLLREAPTGLASKIKEKIVQKAFQTKDEQSLKFFDSLPKDNPHCIKQNEAYNVIHENVKTSRDSYNAEKIRQFQDMEIPATFRPTPGQWKTLYDSSAESFRNYLSPKRTLSREDLLWVLKNAPNSLRAITQPIFRAAIEKGDTNSLEAFCQLPTDNPHRPTQKELIDLLNQQICARNASIGAMLSLFAQQNSSLKPTESQWMFLYQTAIEENTIDVLRNVFPQNTRTQMQAAEERLFQQDLMRSQAQGNQLVLNTILDLRNEFQNRMAALGRSVAQNQATRTTDAPEWMARALLNLRTASTSRPAASEQPLPMGPAFNVHRLVQFGDLAKRIQSYALEKIGQYLILTSQAEYCRSVYKLSQDTLASSLKNDVFEKTQQTITQKIKGLPASAWEFMTSDDVTTGFQTYWRAAKDEDRYHCALMMALLEANEGYYSQKLDGKSPYLQFFQDAFGESTEEHSCMAGRKERVVVGLRNVDPEVESLFKPSLAFENLSQRLGEWGGKIQNGSPLQDFFTEYLGFPGKCGKLHNKMWHELQGTTDPQKLLSHVRNTLYEEAFGRDLSYKDNNLVCQKFDAYLQEGAFVEAAQRFIEQQPSASKRFKTEDDSIGKNAR